MCVGVWVCGGSVGSNGCYVTCPVAAKLKTRVAQKTAPARGAADCLLPRAADNPSWQLDLGAEYDVKIVEITNHPKCCGEYSDRECVLNIMI